MRELGGGEATGHEGELGKGSSVQLNTVVSVADTSVFLWHRNPASSPRAGFLF